MSSLSLLTLNIANPSVDRAGRQLGWLASRDEDVFVLTETKASDGCRLLADAFQTAGYAVTFPEPGPGEYGTILEKTERKRRWLDACTAALSTNGHPARYTPAAGRPQHPRTRPPLVGTTRRWSRPRRDPGRHCHS